MNNIDEFEGLIKMQEDIRIEMLDTQDFVRNISNIYKTVRSDSAQNPFSIGMILAFVRCLAVSCISFVINILTKRFGGARNFVVFFSMGRFGLELVLFQRLFQSGTVVEFILKQAVSFVHYWDLAIFGLIYCLSFLNLVACRVGLIPANKLTDRSNAYQDLKLEVMKLECLVKHQLDLDRERTRKDDELRKSKNDEMLRIINQQQHLEYFPPIKQLNLEIDNDRMNRFTNCVVPLGQNISHDRYYAPLKGNVITPAAQDDLMSTRTEEKIEQEYKRKRRGSETNIPILNPIKRSKI